MEHIEKPCSKCGESKQLSEFHREKKGKYGYGSVCKKCRSRAKPKPEVPEGYKICTTCQKTLPATQEYFKKDNRHSSGIASICKPCAADYSRQYSSEHIEERKEYNKKRYWENPDYHRAKGKIWYQENKPRHRAKSKEWYENNYEYARELDRQRYIIKKEEIKAHVKQWRKDNPEAYRAYNEQWFKDNPEKAKAIRQTVDSRRRARERELPDDFTFADWESCLAYWGRKCAICGRSPDDKLALAADHWIPLKHPDCPGTVFTNMIPLCDGETGCNTHKQARDAIEWLVEKFGEEFAKQKLAEIETFFKHMETTRSKGINNV
jgi:hypothetical protein